MNDTMEKLQKLIDKRKERNNYSGGDLFIIWGCIILASQFFQIFILNSFWVSVAAIFIGAFFQFTYIKLHRIKSGYIIMWKNSINYMWLFTLTVMLIAGWLFPNISKLYSSSTGIVLVFFFLSSGFLFMAHWLTGGALNWAV